MLVDATNTDPLTTSLSDYCQHQSLPAVTASRFNSGEILAAVRAVRPDLALSVNNHQILRSEFLAIPREGVINFHNSALPRYGGLNACTWAIVNGEREHGVTLHYLDAGVDTGDILAQATFPIPENSTALPLIARCLDEGKRLFQRQLPAILNGTASRTPQDLRQRSFYRKADIPNGGRIDFAQPYQAVHNLIRGLNFHPLPNPLAYPRAEYRGRTLYVDRIGLVAWRSDHVAGTVIEASENGLQVQVQDAVVRLLQVPTRTKTVSRWHR